MKWQFPELRIPGPTPIPPAVIAALSQPMISHRSEEFHELLLSLEKRLKQVLNLNNDILFLSSSGTGGLEAAIANAISPGDKVLSVSIGHFGKRFREIAERYGAQVDILDFPHGSAADPNVIADKVKDSSPKAILLTHCETSTGVLNDLKSISAALPPPSHARPLVVIDGISSLGGTSLGLSETEADIVVMASQKAWMAPPGLAMLAVSDRTWHVIGECNTPRLYFDLRMARKYAKRGETPWTPAIPILYALDAALNLILDEGIENVYARHRKLAWTLRQGLRDLGLQPLANEQDASPTVTAARLPEGIPFKEFASRLRNDHGMQVANGQDELRDVVFRVGHMGCVTEESVGRLLRAVQSVASQVRTTGED